jgi:hypothetical protein
MEKQTQNGPKAANAAKLHRDDSHDRTCDAPFRISFSPQTEFQLRPSGSPAYGAQPGRLRAVVTAINSL